MSSMFDDMVAYGQLPFGYDRDLARKAAKKGLVGVHAVMFVWIHHEHAKTFCDHFGVPKRDWQELVRRMPNGETLARGDRDVRANEIDVGSKPAVLVPEWYIAYTQTPHWLQVCAAAETRWRRLFEGSVRCIWNRRHAQEQWHHDDYGRLGEWDEYELLVPTCGRCHTAGRVCGPALPAECPEAVKQWL